MDNKGQAFLRSLAQNEEKGDLGTKRRPKGDQIPHGVPRGTRVSYMGPNWAEWVQFITASENSRHGAKIWLFLDHFNIYPDRVQNSGPQLFHWSCHWVRGILLSPASPWLHLVGREKLAASIKSPMLHSISKTLPVQSSVSFGTIIWAKIDYLFLPHLLQQVQASPLYCHLFQHSLETKDKPGWDDQGWFHP